VIVTDASDQDILPPHPVRTGGGWSKRWTGIAVVVAVLAAAVGIYFVFLRSDGGQKFPKAWDPRVADLATYVQQERGLTFKHPVEIEFLAADAFEKLVRQDQGALTPEDKTQIENSAAFLRALGLIGSDVDLFKSINDISGGGTLAYYDYVSKTIKVKGTEMSPSLRSTLVHEMTHTLQDQYFDLGRIQNLDENTGDALRGLAEGDANRIEHAYEATLSDADKDALDTARTTEIDNFNEDQFPPVLTASFSAPYALGEPLAMMIFEAKGQAGLDKAFKNPPTSDAALLDPLGYIAGLTPAKVAELVPAKGEESVDTGQVGAFGLYLVLAQRLDLKRALTVATGWGGDSYLQYKADGRTCVRTKFVGRDVGALADIDKALVEWTAASPAGTATVTQADGNVILQSCDPGSAAVATGPTVDALLGLPTARAQIAESILKTNNDQRLARCFSEGAINLLTIDQLSAQELDAATTTRLQNLATTCRTS
jgi:hypothetical protein